MIFPNRGKDSIEITKELRALRRVEPSNSPQRTILRSAIMGYELGDIQKFAVKYAQQNLDSNIKKGLEENAKLGMADLVIQLRMFCEDMGWEFDSIQALGLEHLKERHEELKVDGWADK